MDPLVPNSPCGSVQSGKEVRQTGLRETADAMEEIGLTPTLDSPSHSNSQASSSSGDDDMDDERDFESVADSSEERQVLTDEDFEASVLRATGNNFSLSAQLISQLYRMYQHEDLPLVSVLETHFHKCVGGSFDQAVGSLSGGFISSSSYIGQRTNSQKRHREGDKGNDDEEGNDGEGNGDGDQGSTEGGNFGESNTYSLVCPFNKRHPQIHNRFYRSPSGRRGEYKTCESGFDTDHRFK